MLFPVKLKLAHYEAEAMRQYLQRMLETSLNPDAKNEVIVLAEHFQKFDSSVRSKVFRVAGTKTCIYSVPLSVARILWYRWQQENGGNAIQSVLGKIDYELNTLNRVPHFPKTLI
jgi:hypothetical protein